MWSSFSLHCGIIVVWSLVSFIAPALLLLLQFKVAGVVEVALLADIGPARDCDAWCGCLVSDS